MKVLRQTMRPELLNRFDKIILFNNLDHHQVGMICDLMLVELNHRLASKGVAIVATNKLRRELVERGYDPKYGARPLRRVIQDLLEDPLADQLIMGKIRRGDVVRADWVDGQVQLARQAEGDSATSRRRKAAKSSAPKTH